MRDADRRGEALGLSEEELAFYDALSINDSVVKVLGHDKLRQIVGELVKVIRNSITIDWTLRENVRANLRVKVKRLLHEHGYSDTKEREQAAELVLKQAEVLFRDGLERA